MNPTFSSNGIAKNSLALTFHEFIIGCVPRKIRLNIRFLKLMSISLKHETIFKILKTNWRMSATMSDSSREQCSFFFFMWRRIYTLLPELNAHLLGQVREYCLRNLTRIDLSV